ncbi:MAG: amidase family protein, partial [Gemmataceae bacterium]|nr:amidase family protein [Gemmataceae bacterium]
ADAIAVYYLIATAEASSNLARYDGMHYGHRTASRGGLVETYCRSRGEGFGSEVKRRIMLGTFVLSSGYRDAYYVRALRVRRLIKEDFDRAFAECDLIAGPTTPTPAFRLGEKVSDPLAMYLSDVYTISANLAGLPALSLPCGWTKDGLPIGLQLQAPLFQEARLLAVAHQLEQALDLPRRRPGTSE